MRRELCIFAGMMTRKHIGSQNLYYRGDREILGLQILKFLCALFVVQIHFDSGIREFLLPVARMAVPVFFMITGYFLPDASGHIRRDRLKKMFKKVFRLELVACAVYLGLSVLSAYVKGEEYPDLLSFEYWFHLVMIGDEPRAHLWYMIALMQAIVIIAVCVALKAGRWIFWLIPIGLALNFLFGSYSFAIDSRYVFNDIFLSRNVLTVALPFMLIGTLIRCYEYKLPSQGTIMMVAGVGLLGVYVETEVLYALFANEFGDIVFMTIPLSTAVFVFFLRLSVKGRFGGGIANWGRAYSMDIYLWHIAIASVVLFVLKNWGLVTSTAFDAMIAIAVTLLGVILLKKWGLTRHIYR